MRDKTWFPIAYMFVITLFFSSILIGFSRVTRRLVEANQQLSFEKAVLAVLPVELPAEPTNLEYHKAFEEQVLAPDEQSAGAYVLRKDNKVAAYALPVEGQGFWAPIKGVIGIKDDKRTITGIAFYEQNETPGLGAEITQLEFRKQFVDKQLAQDGNPLAFRPAATAALADHEVHAITGATQTSTRVERFLNEDLKKWRETIK